MNALFVTYDFPYPTNTGGKNRAFNLLKYAAKHANVTLYSFVREDFNPDHIETIKQLGITDIKIFKRRKFKEFSNFVPTILNRSSIFKTLYYEKEVSKELLDLIKEKEIDIVHFESSYTGYYIGDEIKKMKAKQVLGTENIEHRLYIDYAKKYKNPLLKPFLFYQANRLKLEEEKMIKDADISTAITIDEADYIKSVSRKDCVVVGNGVDVDVFSYKFNKKLNNNLLFVGNFTYFPNVDAMNFFYSEVFKKLPENMTLTIVGKKGKEVLGFKDERIIFKEFVDDIVEEYRNSDLLVFPVRIGGGTNFKVLEAMALGIPIVAHPERLKGLGAISGIHFLEADDGSLYLSQIKRIYEDDPLREKIAKAARVLIEGNFTWERISLKLLKAWRAVL